MNSRALSEGTELTAELRVHLGAGSFPTSPIPVPGPSSSPRFLPRGSSLFLEGPELPVSSYTPAAPETATPTVCKQVTP